MVAARRRDASVRSAGFVWVWINNSFQHEEWGFEPPSRAPLSGRRAPVGGCVGGPASADCVGWPV